MRLGIQFLLISFVTLVHASEQYHTIFGAAQTCGHRRSMEDAHHVEISGTCAFFGLYDGHGGADMARFAARTLHTYIKPDDKDSRTISQQLHTAFIKTHHNFHTDQRQGCTALVAYIHQGHLFVANAGDSRAVLCNAGTAVPLSVDHKPSRADEKQRIERCGGHVTQRYNTARVNGSLAVSRALGDKYLHRLVIPDPEISCIKLARNDEFLILACDGLWDVVDNQSAVNLVKKALQADNDLVAAARLLQDTALVRGSKDNISVIIIDLKTFKTDTSVQSIVWP